MRPTVFPRLSPLPTALAALTLAACSPQRTPPPSRVAVSVARAERRAVPVEILATGTVEPIRTVAITSQVGGMLQRVLFNEGDEVTAGQVLFQIDPRPFEAALQQAQANLSRDLVQLANAGREADRARTLETAGLGTAEDAQAKMASHDALAATVRADSAALMGAQLALEYATIRAPIAGRTGGLMVREGNLVRSNTESPLVTINQVRPIYVRFAVPAARLPELQRQRGRELQVLARPARDSAAPFRGALSFIDNHVDSTTGTVLLKGRFANASETLWPGEFVEVTLQLDVQDDAIVVPAQAVMNGQQGSYVFVVENGRARQVPVTVARSTDSLAVIAQGLVPGATVVIDGQLRLTQDAPVELKDAAPEPGGMGARDSSLRGDSARGTR